VWGLLAARLSQTPAIITRRVDNPENPWVARLKYKNYNAVVSVSNGVRKVMARSGISPKDIKIIPDCVDIDRFTFARDTQWFFKTFGFKPYHQVIGMIAQFIPRKGHSHIVEAAPEILRRYPNARFLFLGKGPLLDDFRSRCNRQFPDGSMVFAGYRLDLPRILPNLTLVVHPAEMEGMGVALLESAASGVPVVASRIGGIPEVVVHNKTGYLIQPQNPSSITKHVSDLLSDPQKAIEMGKNGRNEMVTRFSIEQMVDNYLCVYRSVLEK
jgi:glycosyltransferase involved in cell wall biosynthesis